MSEIPFRSGGHFRARHLRASAMPGLIAAGLVTLYLSAVMQLGSEGWWAFGIATAVAAVMLTPLGQFASRRMDAPIARTLDREQAGLQTHDDVVAGYRAATRLPLRGMCWYFSNWVIAAVLIPPLMALRLGSLSYFAITCIAIASLSGGLAAAPFVFYTLKALVRPIVRHWAEALSVEERAEHGARLPLRHKLRFPIAAVSAATVAFMCLLAYSLASWPVEAQDLHVKDAYLGYASDQIVAAGPGSIDLLRDTARGFRVAEDLLLLEGGTGTVLSGTVPLAPQEVEWVLSSPAAGDSRSFDSDHSFAWRTVPDGTGNVLVALTPRGSFASALDGAWMIFAFVFIGAMGFGLGTARLLVRDVTAASEGIRDQAEAIASGDFLGGAEGFFESEDELGDLARTFSHMKDFLRETVAGVAKTASRLDQSAKNLASIGVGVAANSQDQVQGIQKVASHVGEIDRRIAAITEASHALSGNVEEASSSVLELGAAGEELHSTAQALNSQIEDVTTSIEQMVRSVNAVSENSEGLSEAVLETCSSMSEMTRAMTEVEGHATETSKLSTAVVGLAESGREQVQQTIKGMDDIRDATESAESVIRTLAGRMNEIGAIVDVIDDVADETNLLALNAAIIAAQSGEQGRAFSVVADEIKDLADRVLSSTREIGSLISSVQGESAAAATAIERGTERVQDGVDLSAQAGVALEEITAAARDSGGRIQEIVGAVREQSRAAGHVEQLMERVSTRVEEIRTAGGEQQNGNEIVMRGAVVMRDVAQQTQRTTEEQSSGAGRIRDSMESVRDAVEEIHRALQDQGEACRAAVSFLEEVHHRTRSNDESAEQLRVASEAMQQQAEALRDDVRRFRIE